MTLANGGVRAMTRAALALSTALAACGRPRVGDLEPVPVPEGVNVIESVETYQVSGADRATIGTNLRAGITDASGRRFAGYHTWRLSYHYETEARMTTCSIVRPTVTLTSIMTLPVWTPPPGVDSTLVRDWERYRQALTVHERGHRAITYAGAGRVIHAIRDVPDMSCNFIGDAVRRAVEPLLAEIRSEDARYDTETRHGATQGAMWRMNLPPMAPAVPAPRP